MVNLLTASGAVILLAATAWLLARSIVARSGHRDNSTVTGVVRGIHVTVRGLPAVFILVFAALVAAAYWLSHR